jgi:organic hydroperoxide reductase OsmC/OhrA
LLNPKHEENPMPMPKTHVFETGLRWNGGAQGTVSSLGVPSISISSPIAFGGTGDDWTPEQLLVASAESCILLTFLAHARLRRLAPASYESHTTGTLAPDGEGRVRFVELVIHPRVTVRTPDEAAAVRETFERMAGKCFIGSSLKSEPRIEPEITVAPEEARPADVW